MHAPLRSVDARSRRSLVSIAAVLVAMFCSLSTGTAFAAATEWTAGPSFGAGTNISVAPVVVGDSAGGITAAWAIDGSSTTRSTVLAQHVSANGTRGPLLTLGYTPYPGPLTLTPSNTPVTTYLSLVPTKSGAVLSWEDPGAADPNSRKLNLNLVRIDANGNAGPVRTVDTGVDEAPYTANATALAANAAGDVLLAWEKDGFGYLQRFAADDTAGSLVDLPDPTGSFAVAVLSDGTGRVAYGSGTNALSVARVTPAGTLDGAPVKISGDQVVLFPGVLAAGNGTAAVSWTDQASPDSGEIPTLRSAWLPSTGTVVSPAQTISGPTSTPFSTFALAMKPDGTLVNAWSSPALDGAGSPRYGLTISTLTPDLSSSVQRVSTPGLAPAGTSALTPSLSAHADGSVGVSWAQFPTSLLSGPVPDVETFRNAYRGRATTMGTDGTFGPDQTVAVRVISTAGFNPATIIGDSGGRSLLAWAEADGAGSVIKTSLNTPVVVPTPTPTATPAAPAALPAPTPAPVPAPTAPKLSLVSFSKKSIVPGDKALFVLTLSAPGTVKIAISKPTSGRKSAGKCVAQTKKNAKKAKCTFDKAVTTITQAHAAGRTTISFNGTVGKKKLPAGSYKATITVTGATGLVSSPTVITFKVKKATKKK